MNHASVMSSVGVNGDISGHDSVYGLKANYFETATSRQGNHGPFLCLREAALTQRTASRVA